MTPADIATTLDLHAKWLRDEPDGVRANLYGANLDGANLYGANLVRANLYGASLVRANLMGGVRLVGMGALQIGPIGSRGGRMTAFFTDKGIYVRTGCFFDTLNIFAARVEETHGNNKHGNAYRAAIALVEAMRPAECLPVEPSQTKDAAA